MSGYGAIADRYARAIFELGVEANQLSQISLQIRNVADAYAGSRELRVVLDNPLVEESKRDSILQEVARRLGLGQLAVNAIRLLASRHKLRVLPDIAKRLSQFVDEKEGILRATVTTAQPLGEDYFRKLQQQLETATKKKIVLERKEDPSLIAGVVTRIGDNTIDGSIKGRLREMERQLLSASA